MRACARRCHDFGSQPASQPASQLGEDTPHMLKFPGAFLTISFNWPSASYHEVEKITLLSVLGFCPT